MRIRFTRPTALRLEFAPGDEIVMATPTAEVRRLLEAQGFDGKPHAHVVNEDGEEVADQPVGDRELAVTGGSRRGGGQRSAPVSR